MTFNYGQRHWRELQAARDIAHLCGVDSHEVCDLGPILKGRSPLTDHSQELEQYKDYESMDKVIGDRVELTFVPMRNALFLTLAANRAAVLGIETIYTGVCQQDNANYPDCRLDFVNAQESAINQALGTMATGEGYIHINTPLMFMSKAESIKQMLRVGELELLAFSHTAYDGQYPPLGKDHATLLRAQGFAEAGMPDPLMVRAWMEGHIATLDDVPGARHMWGAGSANLTNLCDAISAAKAVLQRRDLGDLTGERAASLEAGA
jgi:7-cyano-7-deazaguanine synthase